MTNEYIPDDRELVVLALQKDPQAFSLLLHRHKKGLASYIQQHFNLGNVVEDMIFITFDKAFRKLEHYNPQFAFSTWLYTIAHHTCIDYARKKRALVQIPEAEDISTSNDPESEMIDSEEAAQLIHYINRLKPTYREPARLRFLRDYAYEDIARELAIPLSTIKTRIHRAKKILSQWITSS
ncbi:MAG: RNA polymerase sigma factor [Bacteroidales bacterium]|nr:RNA polymerase sigma factor [Bacteroidales bacterium]